MNRYLFDSGFFASARYQNDSGGAKIITYNFGPCQAFIENKRKINLFIFVDLAPKIVLKSACGPKFGRYGFDSEAPGQTRDENIFQNK